MSPRPASARLSSAGSHASPLPPTAPAYAMPRQAGARVIRQRGEDRQKKWRRLAPLGLIAVGAGASAVGEATIRKASGRPWVVYGTAALCVLNAGLCLFGEAVKQRALLEWEESNASS